MGTGEAGSLMGAASGIGVDPAPLGASMAPIPPGLFQPVSQHDFAHPAEKDLARILSFYRIRWVYEPTTFHLQFREDGRPAEQITPDFYLPDHDLYIELTTMRQRLVTRKNRKIRRLRESFPSVHIKLLYRRDYDRLIGSYPAPDHIAEPELGPVLFESETIQERIRELAQELTDATARFSDLTNEERPWRARREPLHLIGVGSGSKHVLSDLGRALDSHACCVTRDLLQLSRYGCDDGNDRVHIGGALKLPVAGRDVVLVADIVSSGLSLVSVTEWLRRKGARSVRVCALLDREDARIIDIPLDFVGFKAPDEVLVGYGLSSYPQFSEQPCIASIHENVEA
ncbi:MAG TPA: phosphoribosyltransferase family protein [Thermomicrobiales bacterium]|nr:phosphoribosyltransferase family protein [Thermomicrobiales bacterium]